MDRGINVMGKARDELYQAALDSGLTLADALVLLREGGPHLLGLLVCLGRLKKGPPPAAPEDDQGEEVVGEDEEPKEAPKPAQSRRPHPR